MRAAYAFDRIMLCVLELSVLPTNGQELQFFGVNWKVKNSSKKWENIIFAKNGNFKGVSILKLLAVSLPKMHFGKIDNIWDTDFCCFCPFDWVIVKLWVSHDGTITNLTMPLKVLIVYGYNHLPI